jgi:hypothetical protein
MLIIVYREACYPHAPTSNKNTEFESPPCIKLQQERSSYSQEKGKEMEASSDTIPKL